MYRFIKQYVEKIDGATIYPLISLFIFLIFFVALLFIVFAMRKDRVKELSNLPFEADELNNTNS